MHSGWRKRIAPDALLQLKQRLDTLPRKSPVRSELVMATASLYGLSTATIYRAIKEFLQPHLPRRADLGQPRIHTKMELERYCEVIAALKLRTTNKKGRHLSTRRAIELLEEYGVDTDQGWVQPPRGILAESTINHYLACWHLAQPQLLKAPAAVRFQARQSNECWQFDMSPSDLKYIDKPEWIDPDKGQPTLMLFSVVDDRSGVAYQEYHCVYGEDATSALQFLFNAMSPKPHQAMPFEGRPLMIYLDNGPVAKSRVFQNVMVGLDIQWLTHLPAGSDGQRVTARSKGKVERPFRTVKEAHETLYHFHKPETEHQANEWLLNYLLHYNRQNHRQEPHSRIEDWLQHQPPDGIREMCSWEQYCHFAREPERRKVGIDARITVEGTLYEVQPELAGETVTLLWGLFDNELYADFEGLRSGPYYPVSGPVPLHHYRAFRQTPEDRRAERIRALAQQLKLPIAAVIGESLNFTAFSEINDQPKQPFPAVQQEYHYPDAIAAKLAIADELALPLARLSAEDRDFIDHTLNETLLRSVVHARVRQYFRHKPSGEDYAN